MRQGGQVPFDHRVRADLVARPRCLLVEVAETSLQYDRNTKGPLYSAAGVEDYWIVNIPARRIEVYRRPTAGGYLEITSFGEGESVWQDVQLSLKEDENGPRIDLRSAAGDTEWQHYRYKVYQTMIPLRNSLWPY